MNLFLLIAYLRLLDAQCSPEGCSTLAEFFRKLYPDAASAPNLSSFIDQAIAENRDPNNAMIYVEKPKIIQEEEPELVESSITELVESSTTELVESSITELVESSSSENVPVERESSSETSRLSVSSETSEVSLIVEIPEVPPRPVVHIRDPVMIEETSKFIPDALRFKEPLASWINPEQVVVLTGGDSLSRRLSSFRKFSSESIEAFCKYHGYTLAFLDQLDYDTSLTYGGVGFHSVWHRVFALPDVRRRWPDAKYVIWLDDDILVPYPETDMLNHYINRMESDPTWEMLYGEEGAHYVLNSGMFFMKARDFAYNIYERTLDVGLEKGHHLAHHFGHEQRAIIELRERDNLENSIRVLPHRDGIYNFNNFARDCGHDREGTRTRPGDAFVHFTGLVHEARERMMKELLESVQVWREQVRIANPPIPNYGDYMDY